MLSRSFIISKAMSPTYRYFVTAATVLVLVARTIAGIMYGVMSELNLLSSGLCSYWVDPDIWLKNNLLDIFVDGIVAGVFIYEVYQTMAKAAKQQSHGNKNQNNGITTVYSNMSRKLKLFVLLNIGIAFFTTMSDISLVVLVYHASDLSQLSVFVAVDNCIILISSHALVFNKLGWDAVQYMNIHSGGEKEVMSSNESHGHSNTVAESHPNNNASKIEKANKIKYKITQQETEIQTIPEIHSYALSDTNHQSVHIDIASPTVTQKNPSPEP
jgi:hypothetical protein